MADMVVSPVGSKALIVMQESAALKKAVKKKPKKKVLDEDTYVEGLEKIIQRDFFPDLPRLHAQKEYIEAMQRNDLVKMRELALKYASTGRPGTAMSTPAAGVEATPSTFETPDSRMGNNSPKSSMQEETAEENMPEFEEDLTNPEPNEKDKKETSDTSLSLDKYLSKHTSEDNASFLEIMESAQKMLEQRNAWLYEGQEKQKKEQEEKLMLKEPEQLALEGPQSTKVKTWTYTLKNMLMYVPDGVEESVAEKIEKDKEGRQIIHANTRFQGNPFARESHRSSLANAAAVQAAKLQGKIGSDGKELVDANLLKGVNGYNFVGTPSPAPGVNESPMMTWGEIEGTPFRLDGSDTPHSSKPGPQFKIPALPKRDRLGLSLVEQASKQHRAKKEAALKRVAQNLVSPSPKRFGSLSSMERIQTLSPAAQKLVNRSVSRIRMDKSLRASYTPSPRSSRGDKTPILKTTPGRTPVKKTPGQTPTPKSNTTSKSNAITPKRTIDASLTDNLLDLPKRSTRATAADFF